MTDYYVDGVDGDNGNLGTSAGSGNAWATIQKAADTVVAGDKVWVKGNGTYVETVSLSTAGTAGWSTRIEWEGYTTTTGDDGMVTIDPASSNVVSGSNKPYQLWKNFRFTGGVIGYNDGAADYVGFVNCRFDNNSSHGCFVDNYVTFTQCQFDNNGGNGLVCDAPAHVIACIAFSNAGTAALTVQGGTFYHNVIYGIPSGDYGIETDSAAQASVSAMYGNTIDGENTATTGIRGECSSTHSHRIVDNIIHDCGTGIDILNVTNEVPGFVGYNLYNSNTTDETNVGLSQDNVSAVPGFENEASDDYTLGSGSAAIDAGMQPGLK
jgi:hypothetical protein